MIITKNGSFGLLNERKKNRGQQIKVIWLFGRAGVSGEAGTGYCQTDAGADGGRRIEIVYFGSDLYTSLERGARPERWGDMVMSRARLSCHTAEAHTP